MVVFSGVLLLTSGFSFNNFYLVLIGVYLCVGLVVTLPLFAMTANLSGIEVDRQIDKVKVFSGDFLRVRVTIRNTSASAVGITLSGTTFENGSETQIAGKGSISIYYETSTKVWIDGNVEA